MLRKGDAVAAWDQAMEERGVGESAEEVLRDEMGEAAQEVGNIGHSGPPESVEGQFIEPPDVSAVLVPFTGHMPSLARSFHQLRWEGGDPTPAARGLPCEPFKDIDSSGGRPRPRTLVAAAERSASLASIPEHA